MGKNAGGIILVFGGFVFLVLSVEGTWGNVWHALFKTSPSSSAGGAPASTGVPGLLGPTESAPPGVTGPSVPGNGSTTPPGLAGPTSKVPAGLGGAPVGASYNIAASPAQAPFQLNIPAGWVVA